MPLPLSAEDNMALVNLIAFHPILEFGIWINVIVSDSNVYKDDNGNLLNYTANLNDRDQGTDKNYIISSNFSIVIIR